MIACYKLAPHAPGPPAGAFEVVRWGGRTFVIQEVAEGHGALPEDVPECHGISCSYHWSREAALRATPILERLADGTAIAPRGGRYHIKRETWCYFSACGEKTAKTDRATRDLCCRILVEFIKGGDVSEHFRWTPRRMRGRRR